MKLRAKILTALLATAMVATTFVGCGNSGSSSSTGSSKEESSKEEDSSKVEAPMDIKWLSFYGPESNDGYPQKFLEEKFNVKISNMIIDRNTWSEQLNVKLAAGEVPDLFYTWGSNEVVMYNGQGILANIPKEKIEEKMPIYYKAVNELEPRLWMNSSVGDTNYGVPLYWENGIIPQSPVYNKKWLEKVGATVPKTLDEYVDVLTKFAKEDPDGNGKNDTYGISFRGKDAVNQSLMNIYWAHGVGPLNWVVNDAGDGITLSVLTEEWKNATAIIQKLYKDGIIDPESITDDDARMTQKFANGRVGILENGNWYHWLPGAGGYRIATDAAGLEIEFGHLPVSEKSSRTSAVQSGGVSNSVVSMGVQVEKDEAKMDKILEILEALHSDKDTYIATAFGKEGEHYNMVDGAYSAIEGFGDSIQKGAKTGVGPFYGIFQTKSLPMAEFDYKPEEIAIRDTFKSDTNVALPYFIGSVTSESKYPDLGNLEKEYLNKFIIGELNLEEDLEAFRAKWLAAGGEETSKEASELYNSQK